MFGFSVAHQSALFVSLSSNKCVEYKTFFIKPLQSRWTLKNLCKYTKETLDADMMTLKYWNVYESSLLLISSLSLSGLIPVLTVWTCLHTLHTPCCMRNCWLQWRKPAHLAWSETDKTNKSTLHLFLCNTGWAMMQKKQAAIVGLIRRQDSFGHVDICTSLLWYYVLESLT